MFFIPKKKPDGPAISGSGAPGPKTLALLQAKDKIEKFCPPFPFLFPFTPDGYLKYLDKCGAFQAESPMEAQRRILSGKFDDRDTREIARAVHHFILMGCASIMVRSDDSPIGTGYRYSGTASVGTKKEEKRLVEMVADEMKKVLASDFSENAQEFNRIKGISGNCGVVLMPVYGQVVQSKQNFDDRFIFPFANITYIGKMQFYSDGPNGHMISTGCGFDWVRCMEQRHRISSKEGVFRSIETAQDRTGFALNVATNQQVSFADFEEQTTIFLLSFANWA